MGNILWTRFLFYSFVQAHFIDVDDTLLKQAWKKK